MGEVYFCGESAYDSHSETLEDTYSISEGGIIDFIRGGRPDLFKKLHQLPVASSEIFINSWGRPPTDGKYDGEIRRHNFQEIVNFNFRDTARPLHQQNLLELQHKRQIQLRVVNGDYLILQQLNDGCHIELFCSHPNCLRINPTIQRDALFVTLRRTPNPGAKIARHDLNYCVGCLEHLFGGGTSEATFLGCMEDTASSFDGSRDGVNVVAAAERLYMEIDTSTIASHQPSHIPILSFAYPSNSKRASALRNKKQEEIDSALRAVARHELRPKNRPSDGGSPDLLIVRPADLGPADERYRKQGLTRYDQQKSKKSDLPTPITDQSHTSAEDELGGDTLYCYCRETDDNTEMIRCSSSNCLIGWFHLECCRLERLPTIGEKFYCLYCDDASMPAGREDVTDQDGKESAFGSDEEFDTGSEVSSQGTVPSQEDITDDNGLSGHVENNADGEDGAKFKPITFQAINNPQYQFDGHQMYSQNAKSKKKKKAYQLPRGHTYTTFEDLAPFMYVESRPETGLALSPAKIATFEEWKASCASSSLLQSLPKKHRKDSGKAELACSAPRGPTDYGADYLSLSEMLAMAW